MRVIDKVRQIMKDDRDHTQEWLAERLAVSQSTVHRWLMGSEPRGDRRDAINDLYEELYGSEPAAGRNSTVPIMGYLGAGAEVEPDYEQVPPEGLDQVDVPFSLPDDMIAFMVRGESMLPVYKNGAVIIVYREQKRPIEAFYGEEAAVRTSEGRRFIKTIMRGQPGVNLISWNAAAIENVRLEWIGEIFATIAPAALRKVQRQGGVQGQLKLRSGTRG